MRRLVSPAVALLAVVVVAPRADADPLDDLGFGAAATAMANARTAFATGAEAAHTNPAGIARIGRPELLAGWQYSHERLELDGHDAGVIDAHGTAVGMAVPVAVDRYQVAAGVALYLPDQFLARLSFSPVTEPHFVRFENAAQRIVVEPVAAFTVGHFAIGAGASLLSDARSKELTFDVGVVAGEKQGQANLDIAMPIRAAPLAGIWWRPLHAVELAATFRGELSLDLALDIRTNVSVPGVVNGDALINLRSASYYTPMKTALAIAVHPHDDFTISAEVAWERWSKLGSGVPDLRVLLELDLMPPLVSTTQPPANFKDIVTSRLGIEWQTGSLRLRAGGAYLPSPVPPQTGLTSFADGARTLAALGGGWRFPASRLLLQPIDLDIALAWQHIAHELVRKDMALVPGGAFSSGGDIVQANITSTVRF